MANESEVTLKVKVDSKEAEKKVEGLTKSFSDSFNEGTKKAESGFSSLFSTTSSGILNVVKGFGLATVAIGAVGFAIKAAFSAAEDIAKIADELGWKPEQDFQSGLELTIRWYLENTTWVSRVQSGKYRGERLGLGS